MRAKKNKSVRIILISLVSLILIAGVAIGIFFALKNKGMRYYLVEVNTNSTLDLATGSNGLAPNSNIISRPVLVGLSKKSSTAFIRAKIVYSSDSEDNRVLSFVNQLNYYLSETTTYENDSYSWAYDENDNAFYLINKDSNLKTVNPNDESYYFLQELIVPSKIKQISSLNSDGNNVQVGEDINLKISFEAVQTIDLIGNKAPTIENVREFFNNFSTYSENGFTAENGFITGYNGTSKNLILPKFVGEDYIIGVKENAFKSEELEKIIIPGSYIHFKENAFYNCNNLNYVAIKSETPIKLADNAFLSSANLEIYTPSDNLAFLRQNYSALSFLNNFKSYNTISTNKTSEIDTNVTTIYAPNITEFEGDFKDFVKLKLIIAPSLTTISEEMFKNNVALIECDTPNVISVAKSAFNGCSNLLNVSFSKKLESIGENSFMGCSRLLNINFVKYLEEIPREAFRGCNSISKVVNLSENLTISQAAFYNCASLRILDINKLTKIDSYAFSQCSSLRYINIKSLNNLDINQNCIESSANALFVFNKNQDKTNFTSNLETLSNKTILLNVENNVLVRFEGQIKNLNLTDFNLVNKITEIGDSAFKDNTSLNTITLPSSVRKIGNSFVSNCTSLTSITLNYSLIPEFKEDIFLDAKPNLTLYVPEKSLEVFKQAFEDFDVAVLSA